MGERREHIAARLTAPALPGQRSWRLPSDPSGTAVGALGRAPSPSSETPVATLIAQECLSNIAKHSGATAARVILQGKKRRMRLSITNNGSGFEHAAARGGLGLIGIRERVRAVGGILSIDPRPGQGTRIDVEVLLKEPAS